MNIKKIISAILIASMLSACSTAGGMYKADDSEHGDFSPGRTILSVVGVLAAVAAVKNSGGGGAAAESGYAWDYQPGNRQWVCRNKYNGQYAVKENCAGLPLVDNWP